MRTYRDPWQQMKERMENQITDETKQQQTQQDPNSAFQGVVKFDQFAYSYLSINSLHRDRISNIPNRITFSITKQGESSQGVVGVSSNPTQVTQLKISQMRMSRKFEITTTDIDDLYFSKIYVLVNPFSSQSYISADGFRYHFAFETDDDPLDLTQIIATPLQTTINFSNPIRFDNSISFDFYTYKPYNFESDQYEVYVDYSQTYFTFYKVDGQDHNLSNLDIVFITNFDVPGILSKEDKTLETYRQNQYRISVIDAKRFEIPVLTYPYVINSINRPADPSLGYYRYNLTHQAQPGITTLISSSIQHGLITGDLITITEVSLLQFSNTLKAQQWNVTVVNPTQFTIAFDSSSVINNFQITIYEFPRISINRQNTLFVRISTKKIEFNIGLSSQSTDAKNNLVNIAR